MNDEHGERKRMKCKFILILFVKRDVETELMFTLDQLDDAFKWVMKKFQYYDNNNDGKDFGINGVIDIEHNNTFEVTQIQFHFRGFQSRKSIKDREKYICIIKSAATHHLLQE